MQLVADRRGEQQVAEVAAHPRHDRAAGHHGRRREDPAALGDVAHAAASGQWGRGHDARLRSTRRVSRTTMAPKSSTTPAPMITQIRRLTASARIGKVSCAPSGRAGQVGQLEGHRVDAEHVGRGVEQHRGPPVRRQLDLLATGDLDLRVGDGTDLHGDRDVEGVADQCGEVPVGAGERDLRRARPGRCWRGCRSPRSRSTAPGARAANGSRAAEYDVLPAVSSKISRRRSRVARPAPTAGSRRARSPGWPRRRGRRRAAGRPATGRGAGRRSWSRWGRRSPRPAWSGAATAPRAR